MFLKSNGSCWSTYWGVNVNNVLRMVLVTLMVVSCFVCTSYGGTDELMKLVQSKDFWSTYKWGKVDESKLYKSTTWKLLQKDDENIRYGNFEADITLDRFKTKMFISIDSTNRLKEINIGIRDVISDDYESILKWCESNYGTNHKHDESTHKISPSLSIFTRSELWKLNDTFIQLDKVYKVENNATKLYVISLLYRENPVKTSSNYTYITCSNLMFSSSDKSFKQNMDNMTFVIDEKENVLRDQKFQITDYKLKVTDDVFSFYTTLMDNGEKYTKSYSINRLTGNLVGTWGTESSKLILTGNCEKVDPIKKKF